MEMVAILVSRASEVANQIGLRPSAVRHYEQIGILPPAQRVSGQRTIRWQESAL